MDNRLQAEVSRMLAAGAEQLSASEFHARADSFGYKVDPDTCCNGTATDVRTGETYPCRSLGFKHRETGLGFSHVDAPRDDQFRRLQDLRLRCFYVANGRLCN